MVDEYLSLSNSPATFSPKCYYYCCSSFHFSIFPTQHKFANVLLKMGTSSQTRTVPCTCLSQTGGLFLSLAGLDSILPTYLLCSVPGLYLALHLLPPRSRVSHGHSKHVVLGLPFSGSCIHCLRDDTSKFHSWTKFPMVS